VILGLAPGLGMKISEEKSGKKSQLNRRRMGHAPARTHTHSTISVADLLRFLSRRRGTKTRTVAIKYTPLLLRTRVSGFKSRFGNVLSYFKYIVTCLGVTIDGVWIGEWIY
jgi:hypothetical protein